MTVYDKEGYEQQSKATAHPEYLEAAAHVRKIRGISLRRFLFLWLQYHGDRAEWTKARSDRAEGIEKGRRWLELADVQGLWGCSRRSAYDYQHAVEAMKLIEELNIKTWNAFLKEIIALHSKKATAEPPPGGDQ